MDINWNQYASRYLSYLKTELSGINLTRILEEEEFYHKQIMDSIIPYFQSEKFKNSLHKNPCYIDIGFGGGFPILPLNLACEMDGCKSQMIGLEARKKKVNAVSK
ncbi:MAG: RsmG family class I SAM-dependent methyltransferase, partial [bacterium]